MEAHVYGFGAFGEDGIVCDPIRGSVVILKGWHWLGTSHFDENLAEGGNLLGGDEEGHNFLFICRGHENFDGLGEREEWTVVVLDGYIFRDKYVGSCSSA